MVMADQTTDYFPVQQQSPDVADEEEVPAETAVPIKNDGGNAHRDRRQQFADTAGGYHYQERAARPLRRGSFAIPRSVVLMLVFVCINDHLGVISKVKKEKRHSLKIMSCRPKAPPTKFITPRADGRRIRGSLGRSISSI